MACFILMLLRSYIVLYSEEYLQNMYIICKFVYTISKYESLCTSPQLPIINSNRAHSTPKSHSMYTAIPNIRFRTTRYFDGTAPQNFNQRRYSRHHHGFLIDTKVLPCSIIYYWCQMGCLGSKEAAPKANGGGGGSGKPVRVVIYRPKRSERCLNTSGMQILPFLLRFKPSQQIRPVWLCLHRRLSRLQNRFKHHF
jgi:hypothetical protein